jgi:hypothetical protein
LPAGVIRGKEQEEDLRELAESAVGQGVGAVVATDEIISAQESAEFLEVFRNPSCVMRQRRFLMSAWARKPTTKNGRGEGTWQVTRRVEIPEDTHAKPRPWSSGAYVFARLIGCTSLFFS